MKFIVLTKRKLIYCGLLLLMICAFLSIQYDYASVIVSQTEAKKNMPVCSVQCGDPKAALTFDVVRGGADEVTALLQILDRHQAKATFFVTGDWARQYPDAVRQVASAGHDVMNHGNTYQKMSGLTADEIRQNIESCAAVIKELTGRHPVLFRAPYGAYNDLILQTAQQLGTVGIKWDIDTMDYKDASVNSILKRVEKNASSGSIIALSSGGKNTVEALPQVIQVLQDKGLEIAPLSDIVYTNDFWISAHGRQYPEDIPSNSLD